MGTDPGRIRDYAQAVEELGYDFLTALDHVLGADRSYHKDLLGPYGHDSPMREPFVLFGFLAGITHRLSLVTNILILPQRQTALVAKQAADLDLLSGGRLILGVGLGWNPVEYEALGQDFHRRGRRMEEQLRLLRALWSEPIASFDGRFDRITRAGINPLPGRQIPIWIGGMDSRVLDRIGRLADGWSPRLLWDDDLDRSEADMLRRRERIAEAARASGRDPSQIALMLSAGGSDIEQQVNTARRWEGLGATHCVVSVGPPPWPGARTGMGGATLPDYIEALRQFREAFG